MLNFVKTNDKDYFDTFEKLFKSIGDTYYDEDAAEYKEITFFYVRRQFLVKYPQFMTPSDREKFEKAKKENNTNNIETSAEAEEKAA